MRLIFLLLIGLLLTACGPRYETEVTLIPPRGQRGQACVEQCQSLREACTDHCAANQRQCEKRARMEDDMDRSLYSSSLRGGPFAGYGAGIGLGGVYGGGLRGYQLCQPTACESHCAEEMYACYTPCGGTVQRTTRCAQHCPPEPHP